MYNVDLVVVKNKDKNQQQKLKVFFKVVNVCYKLYINDIFYVNYGLNVLNFENYFIKYLIYFICRFYND